MSKAALEGIKVIEFATMVSGPYCGKLLADLGADVIKVESSEGDPARFAGPFPTGNPDPEKSALFLYNNTSKRGITLDIKKAEDLETFIQLVSTADALIDNHSPNVLEDVGLGWEALHQLNPALVYTCITPYGRTGPRANVKGDELTLIHAGGVANLLPARSTHVKRAPVKMGGYQVGYHGGIYGALATLAAVIGNRKTGKGQLIDISLQEVVLSLVGPIVAYNRYHKTTWNRVPDRPPAMGRMQTSDGYVILAAADDHHFRTLRKLMGNPEWAASDQWDDRYYRSNHLMEIAPMMDAWMLKQKKDDIHHKAAKVGIPIGPVSTAKDVMESPQYKSRNYFVTVDHPKAGPHRYAGWPYKMSATPPQVSRPAPLLGQHNREVINHHANMKPDNRENTPGKGITPSNKKLPLEGIRVLDFCWVWAGPYASMYLASLGAEVIKIEGHNRSDLMRRVVVWPLPDTAPTAIKPNQGMGYNIGNMNKKGITLDISKPEGNAIVKKLVSISDVVIDNMRPGAMKKLGLGYGDLNKIKPDIIVISTSRAGHEGPETDYLGFASIHHGYGGGSYLTGYPDDHPTHSSPGDVDIMNATVTAYSAVAAIYHRLRTGEGQFIDYSQCEGVSSLNGEALLGYEMIKIIPERIGNAHPVYAPHSVYRCWGVDRWLALEVHSDEEFLKLAHMIQKPELLQDSRFKDMASRKQNEKALDEIIESWTRERDRDWMANEMCKAGLSAAPSRDGKDLHADPHLKSRKAFVCVSHPEIEGLELARPPWVISDIELPVRHAPLLGEHNNYVFKELLGLGNDELAVLEQKDIIVNNWPADKVLI